MDAVLFGSADSNFYSVDKNTGNLNWSFRTNGGIHSDQAISDSDVLFGSYDGCLYSLDARREWHFLSGRLLWSKMKKHTKRSDFIFDQS